MLSKVEEKGYQKRESIFFYMQAFREITLFKAIVLVLDEPSKIG